MSHLRGGWLAGAVDSGRTRTTAIFGTRLSSCKHSLPTVSLQQSWVSFTAVELVEMDSEASALEANAVPVF